MTILAAVSRLATSVSSFQPANRGGGGVRMVAVVGERELANGTVNVRTRDNKVHGEHPLDHVTERFRHFRDTYAQNAEESF